MRRNWTKRVIAAGLTMVMCITGMPFAGTENVFAEDTETTEEKNLLPNGNFEDGEATGWKCSLEGKSGYTVTKADDVNHTDGGTYSIKIADANVSSENDGENGTYTYTLDLLAAGTYTFSGYVKSNEITAFAPYKNGDSGEWQDNDWKTEWMYYEDTFTVGEDTSDYEVGLTMYFKHWNGGTGTTYLDDFSLVKCQSDSGGENQEPSTEEDTKDPVYKITVSAGESTVDSSVVNLGAGNMASLEPGFSET